MRDVKGLGEALRADAQLPAIEAHNQIEETIAEPVKLLCRHPDVTVEVLQSARYAVERAMRIVDLALEKRAKPREVRYTPHTRHLSGD